MDYRYAAAYPLLNPPVPQNVRQQPITGNLDLNAAYEAENRKKRGPPVPPEVVYKERRMGSMFKIAVISTVLFVLLSHNMAYKVVNQIYGTFTGKHDMLFTEEEGCPTVRGILVHGGVFFIIMMILMFRF
jgi:hypothetical protein